MIAQVSVRGLLAWVVLGCGTLAAQSSLPPMAPTVREKPVHRAFVVVADGKLTVNANNSSLNDILRDIGRRTGIRIKGGVIDEQVYGQYGPAAPAQVLAVLLNETSSNMLLALNPDTAEFQLVLTPKQGGPTPPNPQAAEIEVARTNSPVPPSGVAPGIDNSGSTADRADAAAPLDGKQTAELVDIRNPEPVANPTQATAVIAQNQIFAPMF